MQEESKFRLKGRKSTMSPRYNSRYRAVSKQYKALNTSTRPVMMLPTCVGVLEARLRLASKTKWNPFKYLKDLCR